MKGILLISHGKLAEGMLETLKMFSGDIENIDTLSLMPGEDLENFTEEIEKSVEKLDEGEGVVIFSDLMFGTPSNSAARLLQNEKYKQSLEIITGMNLPMILEYTGMRDNAFDGNYLVETGHNGIVDLKSKFLNR